MIGVWYERGYENAPLRIHATTNVKMQYLNLYLGEELLGSWSAADAEIEEHETYKDWIVEYTFEQPGEYYLWYKASADGVTEEVPYAPDPVEIERPALINVRYEEAKAGTPLKIHVTTNLAMQNLYLYLGGDQLASWSADEAEIEEYATCKDWTVEYTFMGAGEYYLWYKASKDGETEEVPYAPDPVKVEEAGEEEPVYSDFRYVLNEEGTGVVITAYLGSAANVEVPEAIEGVAVTEIGADAFLNNATLTRITLPQTVERIGARAFKNCTALCEMN